MILGIEALHINMNRVTGIERYLMLVLEAFDSSNMKEIESIVIFCSKKINFSKFMNLNIVTVITNDDNFVKTVNESSINILHCTFVPPNEAVKIPIIYTLHDTGRYLYPEYMDRTLMDEHIRRLDFLLSNSKCTILTVSEASKDMILEVLLIDKEIIFTASPYIGKQFISEMIQNKSDYEKPDYPYILVVGCFIPTKNVISIIQCFEKIQLDGNMENHKLVIVGKQGWDTEVENRSKTCANIIRLTDVTDEQLVSLYRNCEFFVSASLIEGFGMPILEAAYLKAPIICSDIKPYREILEDKPLYFSLDKTDALYFCMQKINREKQDYSNEISKFSAKNMGEKLINAYNATINYFEKRYPH